MGFWKSFGKTIGKIALIIAMPGAVAGYEYQKQKAIAEVMKDFDEAINALFKQLAALDDSDGWSEILVFVRNVIIDCLTNKKTRDKILSEANPNERARTCCEMALGGTEVEALQHIAHAKNVNLNLLKGALTIQLSLCDSLDKHLLSNGIIGMEEHVMRLVFDIVCTRLPLVSLKLCTLNDNEIEKVFEKEINTIFSDEDNEVSHICKMLCEENKISYDALKKKMLRSPEVNKCTSATKNPASNVDGDSIMCTKSQSADQLIDIAVNEEPTELGVRQKIEIARCLYDNTCIAVADAYETIFVKDFPSQKGSENQTFITCMLAAVSWLTMYSYDCRHSKARTAQIMGWLELASRSKMFSICVTDMQGHKYRVEPNNDATFDEKMSVKCEAYAKWILDVMRKQAISLDQNVLKEQLFKAFRFVGSWYEDKLLELIKNQKPSDPVVPSDCLPDSDELKWIEQCKADIARSIADCDTQNRGDSGCKVGCKNEKVTTGESSAPNNLQTPKEEVKQTGKNDSRKHGCLSWILCLISIATIIGPAVWMHQSKDAHEEVANLGMVEQGDEQKVSDSTGNAQHEIDEQLKREREKQLLRQTERAKASAVQQKKQMIEASQTAEQAGAKNHAVNEWNNGIASWKYGEHMFDIEAYEEAKKSYSEAENHFKMAVELAVRNSEVKQQKKQMIEASQTAEQAGAKKYAVSEWNKGIAIWKYGDDMVKAESYDMAKESYSKAENHFKTAELTANKVEAKKMLDALPSLEARATDLIRDNDRWFKWTVDTSALASMGDELYNVWKRIMVFSGKGLLNEFGDEDKWKLEDLIYRCYTLAENAKDKNPEAMKQMALRINHILEFASSRAKKSGVREHSPNLWNEAVNNWNAGNDSFSKGEYEAAVRYYNTAKRIFIKAKK